MKIIKTLFIGLGVVLLLLIAVIGIFMATFDANQYKQDLSELVQQQTGRALVFEGDIGLTLYPRLGMKLGSMRFDNAAGFGNQPMAAVNHASVSVDVLSLLTFNPQIEELTLDGLELNLMTNKQGRTNWDDLMQSSTPSQPATSGDTPAQATETAPALNLVGSFGGLNITAATLNWKDDSSEADYNIYLESLTTGMIVAGQAFPINLKLKLDSAEALNAQLEMGAQVMITEQKIALSALMLQSRAGGTMIPVDSVELTIGSDVDFSLSTNQLSLKGFSTQIETQGGVLQQTSTAISGEIGFDLNRQQLTIAVLDLQSVLQDATLPKQKINFGMSATEFGMALPQRSLKLSEMTLAVNETQFKGNVTVQDYAQPSASFELKSSKVDVDAIMGAPEKGAKPEMPVDEEKPAEDTRIELPMELLRGLKLDGLIVIDNLIAQGLTMKNLKLKLTANKGLVNLDPLHIDLYEGSFDGTVQVNAQGKQPVYRVSKQLKGFQAGPFLKDFMDSDLVSGAANIDVKLTTQGEWLSQLKSNLNGDMKIAIEDGAIKGFNLRHKLKSAQAKLKREELPVLKEQKTDFSALSISGVIKQGVFQSQDLDLQAPLMRVGGSGSADLANETVDYRVNAKLVGSSKGQAGSAADELSGLFIPVAITGSWLSPKVDVQYDELVKASLAAKKAKIGAAVAKQKAALQQKLGEEKARLKAAQDQQAEAKKAQLEEKRKLAEAEKRAELEAKKKAEQEAAKEKLKGKLKKLF